MEPNSFWLIAIDEFQVTVALVGKTSQKYKVLSLGSTVDWQENSAASLTQSANESLLSASSTLTENQEPDNCAIITPPHWVGPDGKIVADKLKTIETVCRQLKLNPLGFVANNEAIIEESEQAEGFPSSFILVNFESFHLNLSLVYLGQVKKHFRQPRQDSTLCSQIESLLLESSQNTALPPQIIVYGQINNDQFLEIKNYPWISKKANNIFIHFPDIRFYSTPTLIDIYTRVISLQIEQYKPASVDTQTPLPPEEPETSLSQPPVLEEVDPSLLGFETSSTAKTAIAEPPPIVLKAPPVRIRTIPKLPQFPIKTLLIPLSVSPLIIFLFLFYSSAQITLFANPYQFKVAKNATFSSASKPLAGSLPISYKSFALSSSLSTKTTGEKTIGEKAQGEIVVYNKLDKVQSLPRGSVLVDNSGKKFEITTSAQIASSSSDLNLGVINLGQTRLNLVASEIGPEYNLAKDTKLTFKDFPETSLVAKTSQDFVGGSKNQVKAVSATDKKLLEEKVKADLATQVNAKIKEEESVKGTVQTKIDHLEYSREIGEQADEISAVAKATVGIYFFTKEQKQQALISLISDQPDFPKSEIDPSSFSFTLLADKVGQDEITGRATVTGQALPKIDQDRLKKIVSSKTVKNAREKIRSNFPRVYNLSIDTIFQFLPDNLNLLPLRWQNIKLIVKMK